MDFGAHNSLTSRNLGPKISLPSFVVTKHLPDLEGSMALEHWNWVLERWCFAGARSLEMGARAPSF
jgi:hypothetical protein